MEPQWYRPGHVYGMAIIKLGLRNTTNKQIKEQTNSHESNTSLAEETKCGNTGKYSIQVFSYKLGLKQFEQLLPLQCISI